MNTKRTLICTLGLAAITLLTVSAQGALMITTTGKTESVNLTTEGATDWVKLSDETIRDEKDGASYIGVVTGGPTGYDPDGGTTAGPATTWSDGSPTLNGIDVKGNWEAKSPIGNDDALTSLTFDVTGLSGTGQLVVYATAFSSDWSLTASLGGGDEATVTGSANDSTFTIDFTATAGQTLSILYEQTADNIPQISDNIGLSAITFDGGVVVPEPASFALLGLGGLLMLGRHRGDRV